MSMGGDIMEEYYENNVIPALKKQIEELSKNAFETVFSQLREDPELYYAYQANIAMAFKDEYDRQWNDLNLYSEGVPRKPDLHNVANQAAKNFLDLLIKPIKK